MNVSQLIVIATTAGILSACGGDRFAVAPELRPPDDYVFTPFNWLDRAPDSVATFLCPSAQDESLAADEIFIECSIEGIRPVAAPPRPVTALTVMAYNFERGQEFDQQLAWFTGPDAPHIDILLASEVDRGCKRSGNRHVAAELAAAMDMYVVFAVEFVELARPGNSSGIIDHACEHGNAILSRYPLGNVAQIRHRSNRSWFIPVTDRTDGTQPRLGGRIAIGADVQVGKAALRLVVLHFESDPADEDIRRDQAQELVELAAGQQLATIIGGDTNAAFYLGDLVEGTRNDGATAPFLDAGFTDSHVTVPLEDRGTIDIGVPIDLIFADRDRFFSPVICARNQCGDLSDHLPVWAGYALAND